VEDLTAVVLRARSGDFEAFEALVKRFQHRAFGFAYSVLGDYHLAEDAASDGGGVSRFPLCTPAPGEDFRPPAAAESLANASALPAPTVLWAIAGVRHPLCSPCAPRPAVVAS